MDAASQEPPDAGADAGVGGTVERRRHGVQWPHWLPSPKLLLFVVIIVAFGLLCYRIRGDLATAFRRVNPSGLPWLVAAVGAEVASFLCYAAVQRRLLVAGGARLRRRTMVSLTVAATGLTNLVPGGTAPASGWLVNQYRRHGVPLPLALWAVIAGGFTAALSVLLLLLCGAAIAGLLGLLAFAGCLLVLVAVGIAGVAVAHHLPVVKAWLAKDRRLPGLRLVRRAAHHSDEVLQFRATVTGGVLVYALSVANWALDVVVLASAFLVLGLPVPWHALLFAYATAQVAGALAPLPGGIGFVEGGMIGAFAATGAPAGPAVIATVIYRLIATFGMAGMGSGALFLVNRRVPRQAELQGDAASLAQRDVAANENARDVGSAASAAGDARSAPPVAVDPETGRRPAGAAGDPVSR